MQESHPQAAATPYDLAAAPAIVMLLCMFFALLFYFLGDTFFVNTFQPLTAMPLLGFGAAAVTGAAASLLLSRAAPHIERAGLGLLCAAVMAAAAYPLMLRINAATSADGPLTVGYVAGAGGVYLAQDGYSPPIKLDTRHAQLASGLSLTSNTHQFRLWRGALGFYELDLGALRAEYAVANAAVQGDAASAVTTSK